MSRSLARSERELFWAPLAILLLLIIIADALLISRHYHELQQRQRHEAQAELSFLAGLVHEALANEQYYLVEILVNQWGEKSIETTYLSLQTPEGYVLAQYSSPSPGREHELIEQEVDYGYQRVVRLKLETDLKVARGLAYDFALQLLVGSLVLLLLFAQLLVLLNRSRRQRVLEAWAHQDGLTGVANRRRFERTLEIEWRRARRLQTCLALIMIDLDAFKAYNDSLGHQAGDDCLRRVAAAMSDQVSRPADLVARYGGEEFAVILPDTDLTSARHVAERIRGAVEDLQLAHPEAHGKPYVSISLGIAVLVPRGEQHASDLVARADRALYMAKAAGGNRTASAPNLVARAVTA